MKAPSLLAVLALASFATSAHAAFHLMQIEQIIGGINGDTSAQAIQLRLRSAGQSQVQAASIWASDAAGNNRTLLLNIGSSVASSAAGARILLTTGAFNNLMVLGGNTGFTSDFTLATAIPAGFLSAGRLTFEADGGNATTPGTIYWSVSWGGSGYTGSNTGDSTNDSDGNFGPAFNSALPTSSTQGIKFTGAANAFSTTNLADYAITGSPTTVIKNNGTTFNVVPEPGSIALIGALGLGAFTVIRRRA